MIWHPQVCKLMLDKAIDKLDQQARHDDSFRVKHNASDAQAPNVLSVMVKELKCNTISASDEKRLFCRLEVDHHMHSTRMVPGSTFRFNIAPESESVSICVYVAHNDDRASSPSHGQDANAHVEETLVAKGSYQLRHLSSSGQPCDGESGHSEVFCEPSPLPTSRPPVCQPHAFPSALDAARNNGSMSMRPSPVRMSIQEDVALSSPSQSCGDRSAESFPDILQTSLRSGTHIRERAHPGAQDVFIELTSVDAGHAAVGLVLLELCLFAPQRAEEPPRELIIEAAPAKLDAEPVDAKEAEDKFNIIKLEFGRSQVTVMLLMWLCE